MTGVGGVVLLTAAAALWIVVLQGITFAVGHRIGRYNVVDVSWGLGLAGIAVIALMLGGGDPVRRVVLALVVGVWGLRLSSHMAAKTRGRGEDPRYREYLGPQPGLLTVAGKVFGLQGLSQLWVGLPLIVAATEGGPSGWTWAVFALGLAGALAGMLFEAVGDAQLRSYRRDPARGPVLDTGLWAWTRHPNYFGDACVWWGVWLMAATGGYAALTVLSPIAMTYFLVYATGARRLERMMAERPGYREYQRRTSYFVPRPPRRR